MKVRVPQELNSHSFVSGWWDSQGMKRRRILHTLPKQVGRQWSFRVASPLQVVNTMACPPMTTSPSISSATRLSETPRVGAPRHVESTIATVGTQRFRERSREPAGSDWSGLSRLARPCPTAGQEILKLLQGPSAQLLCRTWPTFGPIGLWTTQTKSLSWASRWATSWLIHKYMLRSGLLGRFYGVQRSPHVWDWKPREQYWSLIFNWRWILK